MGLGLNVASNNGCSGGGGGGVASVIGGTNITVDNTDPANPIVNSDVEIKVSNTLYVSKLGNDTTALRERLDLPFQTIKAAKDAAQAFDTIHVFAGIYDVTEPINESGVTGVYQLRWYGEQGAILNCYTNPPLFDGAFSSNPLIADVKGYFEFRCFVGAFVLNFNPNAVFDIHIQSLKNNTTIQIENSCEGHISIDEDIVVTDGFLALISAGYDTNITFNFNNISSGALSSLNFIGYFVNSTGNIIFNAKSVDADDSGGGGALFILDAGDGLQKKCIFNIENGVKHKGAATGSFDSVFSLHGGFDVVINSDIISENAKCIFYNPVDTAKLHHNGVAKNDSAYPCIQISGFAEGRVSLNGTYESDNDITINDQGGSFDPDGYRMLLNGKVINNSTSANLKSCIRVEANVNPFLIIDNCIFINNLSTGTNESITGELTHVINLSMKILHHAGGNADVAPNVVNLITGTNYTYDTDYE